jgi:hypothetical protein
LEVRRIAGEKVRGLYNHLDDMWAADSWHGHTQKRLASHLRKKQHLAANADIVLHVGSAGESYGLNGRWNCHIDLADKRLENTPNAIVGDAHALPIQPSSVDLCTCVGSVLNYCDAVVVLSQISKTLKVGSYLILEFETSDSWEFMGTSVYRRSAALSQTFYGGDPDCEIWLYSLAYIKALLTANNMVIKSVDRSHVISSLVYRLTKDVSFSAKFGAADIIAEKLPVLRRGSANIILLCQKKL